MLLDVIVKKNTKVWTFAILIFIIDHLFIIIYARRLKRHAHAYSAPLARARDTRRTLAKKNSGIIIMTSRIGIVFAWECASSALIFAAFAWVVHSLWSGAAMFEGAAAALPASETRGHLKTLIASMMASPVAYAAFKSISGALGPALAGNRGELTDEEFSKKQKKFCAHMYHCFLGIVFAALEIQIFQSVGRENTNEGWWRDTSLIWSDSDISEETEQLVRTFYLIVMGHWFAFIVVYILEDKDADHALMFAHHLVETFLVCGSYFMGGACMNMGVMILFLHNVSDITLDALKMAHYIGLDGARCAIPLTEILFVVNLLTWIFLRLIIFPGVCIRSVIASLPGYAVCTSSLAGRYACNAPVPLLLSLFAMHIWWVYKLILIAIRLLRGHDAQKVGDGYLKEDGNDDPFQDAQDEAENSKKNK